MRNQERYMEIHRRADNVHKMIVERARKVTYQAGLDGSIMEIHLHNALLSADNGKPWPEVNYKLARKARFILSKEWRPQEILRELNKRHHWT